MRWALVVLLALALAGCGGKGDGANQVRLGDGSRISLDLPAEQQPDPEDIHGAISGVVVDDAIFPVPGATVGIRDRDLSATADEDGLFAFEGMPPGLYTLEVRKEGHAAGLGTVNVKSGQVAKAVVQSPRLPFVAPYHATWAFDEVRTPDDLIWGTAGNHEHVVALDHPLKTLVLESAWQGIQDGLGDPLDYWVDGERTSDEPATGSAPNPMVQTFGDDLVAPDEYAVRLRVTPSWASVPLQAQGKVFATLFYVEPAPPGWSIAGGSA
jgi:hypothetical protein